MTSDAPTLTEPEIELLEGLLRKLAGRGADLPWPLFRFITETAATPNVDLLVRDDAKGVLLAWRDDPFGSGWHVPGSVIRHREEIAHRIAACAAEEFGCALRVAERPVAVVQIFDDRGHSVSLCFPATLAGAPGRRIVAEGEAPAPGDLRWFPSAPEAMYPSHIVYAEVIAALQGGGQGGGQGGERDDGAGGGARVFTQHVGRRDAAQAGPEGEIGAASLA